MLAGEAKLTRYADDFALAFTNQRDAERVFAVLGKRFTKYGLTIHPEKSRLARFERPRRDHSSEDDHGKPEPFDLLGFTGLHMVLGPGATWRLDHQNAYGRRPHPSDDHDGPLIGDGNTATTRSHGGARRCVGSCADTTPTSPGRAITPL